MIYLLRHGDAERGNGDDAARRLTDKGERQSEVAGQALSALADTARLACQALDPEPEVAEELSGRGFDAIGLSAGRGDVLLVGHEPDFSSEIARLSGAKVKLRKGGLAILDGGTLLALLRPEDVAAIAVSQH